MNVSKAYRRKKSVLRDALRNIIYNPYLGPTLRRLLESDSDKSRHRTSGFWDEKALEAGKMENSYLGGLTEIHVRDSLTAGVVRSFSSSLCSVLDVGCGGGSLALEMARNGTNRYLGLDISSVTVERARATLKNQLGPCKVGFSFKVADLTTFVPVEEFAAFDLIVFNEVLYYLRVEVALEQAVRYSRWLSPGGLICVSMLGDPKSEALFRLLGERFEWLTGFRYQEAHRAGTHFRGGDEFPLLMTAILRPSNLQAPSGAQ